MDLIKKEDIRREIAAAANPENYDSGNKEMDEGSWGCAENLLYILDNNIRVVPGGWISPSAQLPPVEEKVLVLFDRFGGKGITTGMYEDGKMDTDRSRWSWYDLPLDHLDEETDRQYIPEGWWEDKEFLDDEEHNHPIDCPVIGWMPLPDTKLADEVTTWAEASEAALALLDHADTSRPWQGNEEDYLQECEKNGTKPDVPGAFRAGENSMLEYLQQSLEAEELVEWAP